MLPCGAGASPAQDGGTFAVMTFPVAMENDPGLAYLELLTGGQYYEQPDEVAEYRRSLTRLHALAANWSRSRSIVRRALKEVT